MGRYGPNEMEREGTAKHTMFTLNGQEFMAIDGGLAHKFTFTPAMSKFITCDIKQEIHDPFDKLSHAGKIHVPSDKYPFSEKFCRVDDKFGVSWQLYFAKR